MSAEIQGPAIWPADLASNRGLCAGTRDGTNSKGGALASAEQAPAIRISGHDWVPFSTNAGRLRAGPRLPSRSGPDLWLLCAAAKNERLIDKTRPHKLQRRPNKRVSPILPASRAESAWRQRLRAIL